MPSTLNGWTTAELHIIYVLIATRVEVSTFVVLRLGILTHD